MEVDITEKGRNYLDKITGGGHYSSKDFIEWQDSKLLEGLVFEGPLDTRNLETSLVLGEDSKDPENISEWRKVTRRLFEAGHIEEVK